ncbi:hypothetical protein L1987_42958 [Smallanthus sonchifolius]|uniref:Uncharacterized protein n=1 Tax=Smallanthus sonchifolius TaxID=185202 RepID=A0ACB9GK25_9ASTR|nr:hypothetical protein L1987_42958 [Smallanthus sonchifolius]
MLGFSDGESSSESSSSGKDEDNNADSADADADAHDHVGGSDGDALVLQSQNEALQHIVEGLTNLVTNLNSTVHTQSAEIKRLKHKNFKLAHSQGSYSKPFKILLRLEYKREKGYEPQDDYDEYVDVDYGHFSPDHQQIEQKTIPEANEEAGPEIPNKKAKLVEKPEIEKMVESPKVYETSSSRKKSIPRRKFKKSEEAIIHDPSKYKLLYQIVDNENEKLLEQAAYLYEHVYSWKEVFGMSEAQVEEYLKKAKLDKKEVEKDVVKDSEVVSKEVEIEMPLVIEKAKEYEKPESTNFEFFMAKRENIWFVVKKHKAYQAQLNKGVLPIASKPYVEVTGEEEREIAEIMKILEKNGFKDEIIAKSSTETLKKMMLS